MVRSMGYNPNMPCLSAGETLHWIRSPLILTNPSRNIRQDYVKRLPAPKFQEWKDIETQAGSPNWCHYGVMFGSDLQVLFVHRNGPQEPMKK